MTASQVALRAIRLSALWRLISEAPGSTDARLATELADELHEDLVAHLETHVEVVADPALSVVRSMKAVRP